MEGIENEPKPDEPDETQEHTVTIPYDGPECSLQIMEDLPPDAQL